MSAEPQAGGSGRSAQTPRPDPSLTVPEGLVVVDKPKGWTSHDVVGRMRRLCGTRKVGHAGTLDPMATGVLIVGVGRGTKLLTHLVGADKTYEATIRLGATTVTDDYQLATDKRAQCRYRATRRVLHYAGGVHLRGNDPMTLPDGVRSFDNWGDFPHLLMDLQEGTAIP